MISYAVFCRFAGAVRAETLGAAGSGQYFGHQLSHLEAVDLPRENQVG